MGRRGEGEAVDIGGGEAGGTGRSLGPSAGGDTGDVERRRWETGDGDNSRV